MCMVLAGRGNFTFDFIHFGIVLIFYQKCILFQQLEKQ